MAKFKKALALVLSLAMVLTLAPIASVNSQAAAKYKISAKTTALAAGKTYNVKVTGVTKNQYVKVARTSGLTVKYNKKTIKASKKVAGTGKALTFKVTANGKANAYKATIKVVIYNKNTNKKVKTLKTTRKIKALPVEELSLKSVEAATVNAAGANVVIAYFNRAVDAIAPADIQIRRVSDGQLYSVDKVVMSSDKKSATITLTGTDAAGAGVNTQWLMPNVDYKMIVTTGGKIAEKEFTIPATITDATVYAVDPVNKTISVEQQLLSTTGVWAGTGAKLTVPSNITLNYEEVLGKTFTIQYDKNNNITKISDLGDKVVIGAFKTDATKKTFTDLATGETYGLQVASGKQDLAKTIARAAKGTTTAFNTTAVGGAAGDNALVLADGYIGWAKLVLNGGNQVKFAVTQAAWTGFIKVGEVKNNAVVDGKTEISLKDYVIIKDGKSIALSDLTAGDVVYYNTTNSFAEVYNNVVEGTLEAVYKDSFKVSGKEYKISETDATKANIAFATKYSKKDAAEGTVDVDYLNALFAGDKKVTVRLNRAGQAVFLDGATKEVVSNTKPFVLVDKAKYFDQSLAQYIRIKAFDGTAVKTFDIDVANLATITKANGKAADKGKAFEGTGSNVAKYVVTKVGTDDASIGAYDSNGVLIGANLAASVTASISTDMVAGELIYLTFNDKEVVTGINFTAGAAYTSGDGSGTAKFKPGYKVVNGLQIAQDTNVYVIDKTDASVTVVKYSAFAGEEKTVGSAAVVYTSDSKNVSAVVCDKAGLTAESEGIVTTEGVVVKAKYSTKDVLTEFSILVGTEVKEYSKFGGEIKTSVKAGDIVGAQVLKDGVTLNGIKTSGLGAERTGTVNVTSAATNTFKVDNYGPYQMTTTGTATIAKLEDGVVTATDLAEIFKEGAANTTVASESASASYVDTIVVKMGTKGAAYDAATAAVTAALDNLSAVMTASGAATTVDTTNDQIKSAHDYEVVKAAYDSVTTASVAYEASLDGADFDADFAGTANTKTGKTLSGATIANFGDYATAKTELNNWTDSLAAIEKLNPTVSNNQVIGLVTTVAKKDAAGDAAVAWSVDTETPALASDGDDSGATIASNKMTTTSLAAGEFGTVLLKAQVTVVNAVQTKYWAVSCGDKTTANVITGINVINDRTSYTNTQGLITVANLTLTAAQRETADIDTLAEITAKVQAKVTGTAGLESATVDCSNLSFDGTLGAGVAGKEWTGNVVVTCEGCVVSVDMTYTCVDN